MRRFVLRYLMCLIDDDQMPLSDKIDRFDKRLHARKDDRLVGVTHAQPSGVNASRTRIACVLAVAFIVLDEKFFRPCKHEHLQPLLNSLGCDRRNHQALPSPSGQVEQLACRRALGCIPPECIDGILLVVSQLHLNLHVLISWPSRLIRIT